MDGVYAILATHLEITPARFHFLHEAGTGFASLGLLIP